MGDAVPIFPTGSRYAPLYFSGSALTRGDAAAKHDVYAPCVGSVPKSHRSTPMRRGYEDLAASEVFTSPGCSERQIILESEAASRRVRLCVKHTVASFETK